MSRVRNITGRNITTNVDMEAADLGIARFDESRNAIAVMFGDNFSQWGMRGIWQSPSIVMYNHNYDVLGVPDGTPTNPTIVMAPRKQLWPYNHNNGEYTTCLPCDFIKVRGTWYASVMVTAGLGNELRTSFVKSPDLVHWEGAGVQLAHKNNGRDVGHPGDTMLTHDQWGDYVYTFGTGGLARNKPVWLWRSEADGFPNNWFEPWGRRDDGSWGWGVPNEDTPILGGAFGELCFRMVDGFPVLSFFDVPGYRQVALTTDVPWGDWANNSNRVEYAWGHDTPQLYGGYITPQSKLGKPEGMGFLVSQWNTRDGSNDPYHVVLFRDTLDSRIPAPVDPPQAPVRVEPPTGGDDVGNEPEPPPVGVPEPDEGDGVTNPAENPAELLKTLESLLKELAASGDVEITAASGKKLTLREAVKETYEATCGSATLKGYPSSPTSQSDLFDHVLSARAEGLINQAFLQAIILAFNEGGAGIDTKEIRKRVKDSL